MATSWILRLDPDDAHSGPILVKVTRKEGGGHQLDLDLLATDGDAAYTAKVRQRSLKKLRSKNYDGSDDDWSAVVSHVLVPTEKTTLNPAQEETLQVACSTTGKDPRRTLSIAIRNKVEDITQRLGTIELAQTTDTDDVDLFGWTLQVVDERDRARRQNAADRQASASSTDTIATLRRELEALVSAKTEHEAQLLNKFVLLLNEKKLKIRNMQRLLSTAQVDPQKLEEVQTLVEDAGSAPNTRGKKRSAKETTAAEESDESDAFETMAVDKEGAKADKDDAPEGGEGDDDNDDEDAHRRRAETPDRDQETETETETEDEDDLGAGPATRSQAATKVRPSRQKSPSPIPPPRTLPFQKKGGPLAKPSPPNPDPKADDDESTASEDDEL